LTVDLIFEKVCGGGGGGNEGLRLVKLHLTSQSAGISKKWKKGSQKSAGGDDH